MPFDIEWPITVCALLGFWGALYLGYVSVEKKKTSHQFTNQVFRRVSQHKTSKMYLLQFFRKTTIVSCRRCQIILVWAETLWGRRKAAAEGKSSNDLVTFDTVLQMRNGYSTRNLTKCACFDVNWYRQWPVAGSVGCLSASTQAYQMTLKISSTTITLEGRKWTFHVWRAYQCTRWKELFRVSQCNYPHCALNGNFKGWGVILLVGVQIVALLQEGLLTQICVYIYTCIFSSLNLLLEFIYVTGWLDPKSCVYILTNKILLVPLLPFSSSPHKLKLCLVKYIIVLVSFRDKTIFNSRISLMFTNDTVGSNYPCVQVWFGSLLYTQGILVDLCYTFASGTGPIAIFLNWHLISDHCTPTGSI